LRVKPNDVRQVRRVVPVSAPEQRALKEVLIHCDMLLRNMQFEYSPQLVDLGVQDRTDVLLNQFTFMHLFTTMFAVDGANRPAGGAVYLLLETAGRADMLDAISEIIHAPVGETTFADYVRTCRNKLTVHGDLSFDNLPASVQAVTYDLDVQDEYMAAGDKFHMALADLREHVAAELGEAEGLS